MVSGGERKSLAAVGRQNATVWRPKAARAAAKDRGAARRRGAGDCARGPWAQSTILYFHNKLDRTQSMLTYGASSNHYGASSNQSSLTALLFEVSGACSNLCSLTVLCVITYKPRAEGAFFVVGKNVIRWEISLNREHFS